MRITISTFILIFLLLKVNAQTPSWSVVNSHGGADYDWGQSVASDTYGNTVVVGAFNSTSLLFGSTLLTNTTGLSTSFIVRYDASGNVLWAKQPVASGGQLLNSATSVEIDDLNNIYISGFYNSLSITFDTITLTKSNVTFAAHYLLKYDPMGNIIWAKSTTGCQLAQSVLPPQQFDAPYSLNKIAINKSNGDIYLAAAFDVDSMVFNSTVIVNSTIDTGFVPRSDIYIAKYDSSGNIIWATGFGGSRQDYFSDISVHNSDLFIAGSFSSSSLNIGSSTLTNQNQNGNYDYYLPFVAKFDTSGNPVWARQGEAQLPVLKKSNGKGIAADPFGNCIFIGEFQGPFIVFNNDTLFNTDTVSANFKIFAIKYNSPGNIIWSETFANGIGPDWAMGVQTDGAGKIYISGRVLSNSISIGNTVIPFSGYGIFIAKLDLFGGLMWIKTPDGSVNQHKYFSDISVSSIGNVFTTGCFGGNIYFGPDTLTSNGLYDIFTAVILNCTPSFSPITAQGNTIFCQGDSVILSAASGYINYQWYRRNYAIPGATSMNYTAKSSGRYSCQSQNATLCIDTSNAIVVNVPCISIGPNQERIKEIIPNFQF